MKKQRTKKVNRSAKDGKFVSRETVEKNPETTITDTVPVGERRKRKEPKSE